MTVKFAGIVPDPGARGELHRRPRADGLRRHARLGALRPLPAWRGRCRQMRNHSCSALRGVDGLDTMPQLFGNSLFTGRREQQRH